MGNFVLSLLTILVGCKIQNFSATKRNKKFQPFDGKVMVGIELNSIRVFILDIN